MRRMQSGKRIRYGLEAPGRGDAPWVWPENFFKVKIENEFFFNLQREPVTALAPLGGWAAPVPSSTESGLGCVDFGESRSAVLAETCTALVRTAFHLWECRVPGGPV